MLTFDHQGPRPRRRVNNVVLIRYSQFGVAVCAVSDSPLSLPYSLHTAPHTFYYRLSRVSISTPYTRHDVTRQTTGGGQRTQTARRRGAPAPTRPSRRTRTAPATACYVATCVVSVIHNKYNIHVLSICAPVNTRTTRRRHPLLAWLPSRSSRP